MEDLAVVGYFFLQSPFCRLPHRHPAAPAPPPPVFTNRGRQQLYLSLSSRRPHQICFAIKVIITCLRPPGCGLFKHCRVQACVCKCVFVCVGARVMTASLVSRQALDRVLVMADLAECESGCLPALCCLCYVFSALT